MVIEKKLLAQGTTLPTEPKNAAEKKVMLKLMYDAQKMRPETIQNFEHFSKMGGGTGTGPYECDVPMYFIGVLEEEENNFLMENQALLHGRVLPKENID